MKLVNTFLTCTGDKGKQWRLGHPKEGRTITAWQHKGKVRVSAMLDADLKAMGDEAKRRLSTTIINSGE
jgi:hypothetical protein